MFNQAGYLLVKIRDRLGGIILSNYYIIREEGFVTKTKGEELKYTNWLHIIYQ